MALTTALGKHAGKMPSAPLVSLALDITFDASYVAGGYDFDAGALLQSLGNYDKEPSVLMVMVENKNGFTFWYNSTAKKLEVYTTASTEVAPGVDLATAIPGPITALILAF